MSDMKMQFFEEQRMLVRSVGDLARDKCKGRDFPDADGFLAMRLL